jgi:hypothetical protein
MFGQTTKARVESLAEDLASIREAFPAVKRVEVKLRAGMVWDRLPSGEVIIRMPDDDYWLLFHLKSRRACPELPGSWDGVPVRFVAPVR